MEVSEWKSLRNSLACNFLHERRNVFLVSCWSTNTTNGKWKCKKLVVEEKIKCKKWRLVVRYRRNDEILSIMYWRNMKVAVVAGNGKTFLLLSVSGSNAFKFSTEKFGLTMINSQRRPKFHLSNRFSLELHLCRVRKFRKNSLSLSPSSYFYHFPCLSVAFTLLPVKITFSHLI